MNGKKEFCCRDAGPRQYQISGLVQALFPSFPLHGSLSTSLTYIVSPLSQALLLCLRICNASPSRGNALVFGVLTEQLVIIAGQAKAGLGDG